MQQAYTKEKGNLTLARLKKSGKNFEVSIDSDAALAFKKGAGDFSSVLKSDEIWADAKKGKLASSAELQSVFKTDDKEEVAKRIIQDGEIQSTADYREKLRGEKEKMVMGLISRNAIDPRTNAPIPLTRLENAFEEARIHVDEKRTADQQVQEILDKLRPVLPLRFEIKQLQVKIPAAYASKVYHILKLYKILKEEWQNDGSLIALLEMPLAMQNDFYDKINNVTHGGVETKEVK